MRAAWYERTGPAAEVLVVGEVPMPVPGPGEVRIRLEASGINPGDLKKRQGWAGSALAYPWVIPHSDGAGVVDALGSGVGDLREGDPVWCHSAQSYRPSGTAAEYVVLPRVLVAERPEGVDAAQGACLGIPGITAHRAVHADGPIEGQVVLVAGGAGGVGRAAVVLARRAGAIVIATVTRPDDIEPVLALGAERVVDLSSEDLVPAVKAITEGRGVDRVIEVAFAANLAADCQLLVQGGVLAAYASDQPEPAIPFWPMLFDNLVIRLLGSDDFPLSAKRQAVAELTRAAGVGDLWYPIAARYPLEAIAEAHEAVAHPTRPGRVILEL